jgi:hypothetical protein
MSKLIESNECGDWLMAEISDTRAQLKSAAPAAQPALSARLKDLQTTKKILSEFLTLQQQMLKAARVLRGKRQDSAGLLAMAPPIRTQSNGRNANRSHACAPLQAAKRA